MKTGSLVYKTDGGDPQPIDGTSFTMPAFNVTVSCEWEEVPDGGDTAVGDGPAIKTFVIKGVSGVINESGNPGVITVLLPSGTSLKGLTPTITTTANSSISPQSGAAQDFSSPVSYTLTAANGATRTYTVTVYTEGASSGGSSSDSAASSLWDQVHSPFDYEPWHRRADRMQANNNFPSYW